MAVILFALLAAIAPSGWLEDLCPGCSAEAGLLVALAATLLFVCAIAAFLAVALSLYQRSHPPRSPLGR